MSRNTSTQPSILPSRSRIGAALSSIGMLDAVPVDQQRVVGQADDRRLRAAPARPDSATGARVASLTMRNTASSGWPCGLGAAPAGQRLGDRIHVRHPAVDVGRDDRVADAGERDLQPLGLGAELAPSPARRSQQVARAAAAAAPSSGGERRQRPHHAGGDGDPVGPPDWRSRSLQQRLLLVRGRLGPRSSRSASISLLAEHRARSPSRAASKPCSWRSRIAFIQSVHRVLAEPAGSRAIRGGLHRVVAGQAIERCRASVIERPARRDVRIAGSPKCR